MLLLSMASRKWSPHKSLITKMYLLDKESVAEIMKYMQAKKNFIASKSAYERQLKAWGCHKNHTQIIWKFIKLRLQDREADGKKSDVYYYGNLIDRAKAQHRAARVYTTYEESHIAPRPKTPDNVAVIPSVSTLYLHNVKSDRLPWQQFCELVELQSFNISIQLPGDMRRIMAPYLVPELISTNDVSTIIRRIVEYHSVILPLDHDDEILDHLKLAFADTSQRSTWAFLKLTVYLLSNKLLLNDSNSFRRFRSGVKVIGSEFLKWFQIGNNRMFCRTLLAIKTPSIDAFAEIIFCSAVENGVTSMIRMFLESGIDPNTPVEHGNDSLTPLQFAAVTGNIQMAQILLEYKSHMKARFTGSAFIGITFCGTSWQMPLQIAARMGNLELVKLLISAGTAVNTDRSSGPSALQNAAKGQHYEIVQLLLDAQADIDTCFGGYGCALACAIEGKCRPLINLLLDNNADVSSSGESGITPLKSAAMVNDEAMVSYLLQRGAKANIPAPTEFSRIYHTKTALHWAVQNGNKNIVCLLLDAGEDLNQAPTRFDKSIGDTTLAFAVRESNHKMVMHLLRAGANINDCRGRRTALEAAVGKNDEKMVWILLDAGADPSKDGSISLAAKASNVGLILALLQMGANINKISNDIPTALYQAAKAEDLEMVQFLLNCGADPNIGLDNYWAPILQILTKSRSVRIIEAIIQAGADCNAAHSSFNSYSNPLQIAASNGDLKLVKYFIAANADVNWPALDFDGRTALQRAVEKGHLHIVEFLLENNADINAPASISWGVTALQAAVSQNHLDLVEFLLENGANPDDQPSRNYGFSALQLAAKSGNDDLVLKFVSAGAIVNGPPANRSGLYAIQAATLNGHIKTVELLIQLGADVNAPACCIEGYTALQVAVRKGYLKIIELLLKYGADVNAPGCLHEDEPWFMCGTALVIAARNGHIRIAKLLLSRGANLIEQGAMLALCEAARNGRLDMMKLLVTRARESPKFNRNHLKTALDVAKKAGHTAAAKFLECHKVIVGSS